MRADQQPPDLQPKASKRCTFRLSYEADTPSTPREPLGARRRNGASCAEVVDWDFKPIFWRSKMYSLELKKMGMQLKAYITWLRVPESACALSIWDLLCARGVSKDNLCGRIPSFSSLFEAVFHTL